MLRRTLFYLGILLFTAQAPASQKPIPVAPEGPQDKILGRSGAKVIRESDFERFLALAMAPAQRKQLESAPGGLDRLRRQFLNFQVMEAKARKDQLDNTPDFKAQEAVMETQILVKALLKRDGPGLKKGGAIEATEVKAYFDAHPDEFKTRDSFSARHILVSVKGTPNAPATALPEAEAKAKALLAMKALREGKSWKAVAKQFSDDPGSNDKGGLYENISYGAFVPEFDAAVRSQALGKVGEPVKTQFGYHLIQVEKRMPGVVPAFETVKEQVKQKAQFAKEEEAVQAYIDGLKKDVGFLEGDQAMTAPIAKVP